MSSTDIARRTEVRLKIEGTDVTADINKYLKSFVYTDYSEDNTDDIRITLDDIEGKWLNEWLNSSPEVPSAAASSGTVTVPEVGSSVMVREGSRDYDGTKLQEWVYSYSGFTVLEIGKSRPDRIVIGIDGQVTAAMRASDLIFSGGTAVTSASTSDTVKVGDVVGIKNGATDYDGTTLQKWVYTYEPGFTVLEISKTRPDRIVIGINGQVTAAMRASDLTRNGSDIAAGTASSKGLSISAVIAQLNFDSDGKDRILDCGTFEVDDISVSGPPQTVTLKATSLPYTSSARNQLKSKAWENLKLSAIAKQIASKNGLDCMYLSDYDPYYKRKEQINQTDITFLQGLCKSAGISLKCTAGMIVLFDGAAYEQRNSVLTVEKGKSDTKTYTLNTGLNDTAYSSCHVSYTDPESGTVIEYTYTPADSDGTGQILEINEKVSTREEARQLAMKRLRQKNKKETTVRFTLVGNVGLVAGSTVAVKGFGMFDGRYIIDTATHNVTNSGYTTEISCTKALEGY